MLRSPPPPPALLSTLVLLSDGLPPARLPPLPYLAGVQVRDREPDQQAAEGARRLGGCPRGEHRAAAAGGGGGGGGGGAQDGAGGRA
eukprot:1339613-Prymnesium_polylepis.1